MFLQIDTRYKDEMIRKYGCYYHSIAFLCNKINNTRLSPGILEDAKNTLEKDGSMKHDCYINYPDEIFDIFGVNVDYVGHKTANYVTEKNELEILCFARTFFNTKKQRSITYKHFVAGNGDGIVTYDSMGFSNAVKYGELESKRIFLLH